MPTVTKTFAFATTAEGFVANPSPPTGTTHTYNASVGNPAGSLQTRTTGRNRAQTQSWWDYVGTWESLGVPAGATVNSIQLINANTRCSEYVTGASTLIGPYQLRDSADTTVLGTLWAGRTVTTSSTSWTGAGSQAAVAVPSGHQASSTTIRIRLADSQATGNSTTAAITTLDDQVQLLIDYTSPPPPTGLVSGSWSFTGAAVGSLPGPKPASFRAAGSFGLNQAANVSTVPVDIPATAQPGDVISVSLLTATDLGDFTTPTNWNRRQGPIRVGTSSGFLFTKTLVAGEPGTTVNFVYDSARRIAATWIVAADATETGIITDWFTTGVSTDEVTIPTLPAVPAGALFAAHVNRRRGGITPADLTWTTGNYTIPVADVKTAYGSIPELTLEAGYKTIADAGPYGGDTLTSNLVTIGVQFAVAFPAANPPVAAVPTGTAAGSWSFAGAAVGSRDPQGTSVGSWSFAGAAAGSAPAVPPASGVANGSWSFTGAAVGSKVPQGTAVGSWSFAGAAVGSKVPQGTAVGSWSFTGAAVGSKVPQGTAVGSWSFAGAAVGSKVPQGTAVGSWSFAGAAVGSAPAVAGSTGIVSGSWSFTGAAVGSRVPQGTSLGSWSFAGAAAGSKTSQGAIGGSWSFTGAASGSVAKSGAASGSWSFAGAAAGSRVPQGVVVGGWSFVGDLAEGDRESEGFAEGVWTFTGEAVGTSLTFDPVTQPVSAEFVVEGSTLAEFTAAIIATILFETDGVATVTYTGDGADAASFVHDGVGVGSFD